MSSDEQLWPDNETPQQGFCPDCHEREFLRLYDDGLDSAYICSKCVERRDRKAHAEAHELDKHFEGRD